MIYKRSVIYYILVPMAQIPSKDSRSSSGVVTDIFGGSAVGGLHDDAPVDDTNQSSCLVLLEVIVVIEIVIVSNRVKSYQKWHTPFSELFSFSILSPFSKPRKISLCNFFFF